jgi:hypothetical protein
MQLIDMQPAPNFRGADFSEWGFEADNPCLKEGYLSGVLASALNEAMENEPPELAIVENDHSRVQFPLQIALALPLRGPDEYSEWRCNLEDLFADSSLFPIHSEDKEKIANELRRIADLLTA